MIKVRVTIFYKKSVAVTKDLEFMSDDFDDYITKAWDKLAQGKVWMIRVSVLP